MSPTQFEHYPWEKGKFGHRDEVLRENNKKSQGMCHSNTWEWQRPGQGEPLYFVNLVCNSMRQEISVFWATGFVAFCPAVPGKEPICLRKEYGFYFIILFLKKQKQKDRNKTGFLKTSNKLMLVNIMHMFDHFLCVDLVI